MSHMPVTDQPEGGAGVANTRAINTTAPLAGGGDLSADRTITLSDGGVSTAKLADNGVTLAKLADIATARILGRSTSGTGDPEALTTAQTTALLDVFTSLLKGLVPASGGGTANFLRADGSWATPPGTSSSTVDLTAAPYSVVASSSVPAEAVRRANTAAINQAITDYSGLKARLVLPKGDVYIDQENGTNNWCIKFPSGTTDVSLVGHGMFSTRLIQHGAGDGGSTHAIMIDGAQRVEVAHLGIQQGTIDSPDPGQQNHLISVLQSAASPITREVNIHDVFFGKALGDQFRLFGSAATIVDVKLLNFMADGAGVVNVASGRTGARSGIALQRGWSQCEVGNGYITGTQNQPIDFEPSGSGTMELGYFHHLFADNTAGNTSVAAAIGGASTTTLTNSRFEAITCVYGRCKISKTQNCTFRDIQVATAVAWHTDTGTPNFDVDGGHTDLVLDNLYLERAGAAAAGLLMQIDEGATRVEVRGGTFIQGTADHCINIDNVTDLQVMGSRIVYDGSSPGSKDALLVRAVAGNGDNPRVDNLRVSSSTGKLRAAVEFVTRNPRTMENIRVTNVHCAGYATQAIWYSFGASSTMDPTPLMYGVDNGTDPVFKQADAGDNPITTIFPIVSGNPGGVCCHVSEATPESALAAKQGSRCTYMNGDSTVDYYKKTGTSNTGWQVENGVAATGSIVCVAKASLADTDYITVGDGINAPKLYEFDTAGDGVTAGRVQVNVSTDTTATEVADRLKTAIEANQPTLSLVNTTGTLAVTHKLAGTVGNVTITENVANAGFTVSGMSGGVNPAR